MEDNMVYIDGRWVKKPTKGRCAYCGSDLLEFYDDGTGICLNCGRTFSWLKPLAGPVTPQAQKTPQGGAYPTQTPPQSPPPQQPPRAAHRETRRQASPPLRRPPEPIPRAPPEPIGGVPEGPGFLSPKAISIMAFLGGLFLGIGAIIWILAIPMGSWPKPTDYELIGNIKKIGMIIWATGMMVFLMAGLGAAGTREMNYKVRSALIVSSVILLILSFSFWIGMMLEFSGFYGFHP